MSLLLGDNWPLILTASFIKTMSCIFVLWEFTNLERYLYCL